jgi:hypothetical protein
MKYFFDTEFHEYKRNGVNTIELISTGIVAEDGREYYEFSREFDIDAALANPWLAEHVINPVLSKCASDTPASPRTVFFALGKTKEQIAKEITAFVGDSPEFYAYYADYDWVVFCWLYGRMIDLPKGFPMYCRDLKQMLDDKAEQLGLSPNDLKAFATYPTQENEHDALDDAKWNRALYEFLKAV